MISDNELFKYTNYIYFELSNMCNLSHYHKECPLSLEKNKIILPSKIVLETLDVLNKFNFNGTIAFHNYNEPLIDPRLIKFIEYSRKSCPNSKIYFSTNGIFLNQIILDELIESGLTNIHISAYSNKEYERLSKLHYSIYNIISKQTLIKDHLEIYDKPILNRKQPCFAPLNQIIISRSGNILLCCRDWKRNHTFGDLFKEKLDNILRKGDLHRVYYKLSSGDRYLDLCSRCGISR